MSKNIKKSFSEKVYKMLKCFIFLFLAADLVLKAADCFSCETFEHNDPNQQNLALDRYPNTQRKLLHNQDINDATFNNPDVRVRVLLGTGNNNNWEERRLQLPNPLNIGLNEINNMINRRIAFGVPISENLLNKLFIANLLGGGVTNELQRALASGGYFRPIEYAFNRLTLVANPPIFALQPLNNGLIPNRVIVHFSVPQRASKNVREISKSSLSSMQGDITLKDKIDQEYFGLLEVLQEFGMEEDQFDLPDSATVISSNMLQD